MRSKVIKLRRLIANAIYQYIDDLKLFITTIQESKRSIISQYIIGILIFTVSLILITTVNLIAFFPKSYDLNPLFPVQQQINPFRLKIYEIHLLELIRGYGIFKDSFNFQGRVFAYQIIISTVIARLYSIKREISISQVFQQGIVAFLLILITLESYMIISGGDVFLEGTITWLLLFTTALGVFLSYEQIQQKRDLFHV